MRGHLTINEERKDKKDQKEEVKGREREKTRAREGEKPRSKSASLDAPGSNWGTNSFKRKTGN